MTYTVASLNEVIEMFRLHCCCHVIHLYIVNRVTKKNDDSRQALSMSIQEPYCGFKTDLFKVVNLSFKGLSFGQVPLVYKLIMKSTAL